MDKIRMMDIEKENEILKQRQKEVVDMIKNWWAKKNNIELIKIHEAELQGGVVTLLKEIENKLK